MSYRLDLNNRTPVTAVTLYGEFRESRQSLKFELRTPKVFERQSIGLFVLVLLAAGWSLVNALDSARASLESSSEFLVHEAFAMVASVHLR